MKKRKSLLRSDSFQTLLTSLLCIILGVAIGYVVLLIINPAGAWKSMSALLKNFFHYPAGKLRMKYFGQTLVRTAPLLMCALSILFAYKVGMFNIGAAGQYVAGACVGLYAAIAWQLPWYLCLLLAIAAGAFLGAISGALRTYCNVNVVISGIMLNWIALYLTNLILTTVKHPNSPYTKSLTAANPSALIPSLGLSKLFAGEKTVTIAIPLAILMAVLVWVILNKTKFGYELKATGFNFNAAKYCGMKENRNVILTMVIAGGLAGMGDLIVTCTSMHSRNRRAGILIGEGKSAQEAMTEIGAVVEGYYAAESIHQLAEHEGVEMPICRSIYEVLYHGRAVQDVVSSLMCRAKKDELTETTWL